MSRTLEELDLQVGEILSGLNENLYSLKGVLREGPLSRGVARISQKDFVKLGWNLEMVGGDEEALRLALRKLVNEYNLQKDAYNAGIRVPKPKGIFGIPLKKGFINPFSKTVIRPGLVMAYIPGPTLGEILDDPNNKDYGKARDSWSQEINKAIRLGFLPGDHDHLGNAIWHPKEKQTYLIDLAWWRRRNG